MDDGPEADIIGNKIILIHRPAFGSSVYGKSEGTGHSGR
jgi:hypothetical protein